MNVDQLAEQTDPRDCIKFLRQNEPVVNNIHVYQKYASQNPFAEKDLEIKELALIREAIVHAKCWKRLRGVITEPYELKRNHDGVLVFLTQAVPTLQNGAPATLFNFLLQHPDRVRDFVIKTLACCKLMVEHGVNHRDLHLNNVMVMRDETVRIIDLGYGIIDGDKISGGFNNMMYADCISSSRDACIFMRSIGLVLHNAFHPYLDMYDRIMRRYARECEIILPFLDHENMDRVALLSHTEALETLFERGGWKKCKELDYMLGRFDWETMTPIALLQFHGINVN